MFDRILNKRGKRERAKGRERGASADPASLRTKTASSTATAPYFQLEIDEAVRALDAGLSQLSQMPVAQAAKERGWATLARQLERHAVRPSTARVRKGSAAGGALRGSAQPVLAGRSRTWRVAAGSVGVAVAITAVLLGTYSAGLLGNGRNTDPVASVTSTAVTAPHTTQPTQDTTPTSTEPGSTSTTQSTGTTTGTTESTPTTSETPSTTEVTTPGGGPPPTDAPPPTEPPSTTTTNEQQMAAAQRQADAQAAALDLADAVVRYFWAGDGNLSGLRSLVASSAQSSLTQMVSSLTEPSGYHLVGAKALSGNSVRVTLEFTDLDDDPRFFITVRVDEGGVTITAISAGS